MATLKGIFDAKPQQQRNFLLENIKKVKTKSNFFNKKDEKSYSPPWHKRSLMGSIPSSSGVIPKLQKSSSTKSHVTFPVDRSSVHQKRDIKPICCCSSERDTPSQRKTQSISSKTMHYIHQENVPFEWTEMCPSVVSHSICHQGVQTDEYCGNTHVISEKRDVHIGSTLHDAKIQKPEKLILLNKPQGQSSKLRSGGGSLFDVSDLDVCQNCRGDSNRGEEVKKESATKDLSFQPDSARDTTRNNKRHYGNIQDGVHADKVEDTVEQYSSLKSYPKMVSDLEALKISSRSSSKKPPSDTAVLPSSYQKGVVPKYLTRRKNEQLMETALLEAVDPNCPAGHIAMPDGERKETLDLILKNYNDLVTELNKMPVRTDTLKMKQRKIELEKQLDKLEEGIRVFSRSKVYIKLNE